ncbi:MULTISPECIES: hypothetical protein [Enterococcus]|uniref:hypothetical protein n=1 Tax=Enterococcus TaxID=1350 RepID=UPI0007C189D7|nr:hypothetical protein [Enterococcus hirae]AND72456.1 hypothetical protein A6P53_06150 [Enterococcus hirae]EMF0109749.1 hypothetical protein [Enterococcus hirae]QKX68426.1 hypothetical protein HU255_04540 [Enterococcus hirae]
MKELQPTNPVSEQESQTTNPVNEQDIEDRINQVLQQNGGNRPIVSRNIFSRSKKTYLDFLNKIESLGDDPHSQRLIMLLEEMNEVNKNLNKNDFKGLYLRDRQEIYENFIKEAGSDVSEILSSQKKFRYNDALKIALAGLSAQDNSSPKEELSKENKAWVKFFSLFNETQRVWINGPAPIQPDHDDNIKKLQNQSKKFDEIRAMRKVKKLSENEQNKAINKNPSKEKSEGSFVER